MNKNLSSMLKSIIENNVRLCLVGLKLLGDKIRVNYNLNKLVLNIEFILRFYVYYILISFVLNESASIYLKRFIYSLIV